MNYNEKTNWVLQDKVLPADVNKWEQGILDAKNELDLKALLQGNPDLTFKGAEAFLDSHFVNYGQMNKNKSFFRPYCVNKGNVDAYGNGNLIKPKKGLSVPFTVTIATPGVITMNGHGFTGGERLQLMTTGALPTGLATATNYYVKYVDANTFRLAATSGGADIATSGTQSGTHYYQFWDDTKVTFAVGTTEFYADPFYNYLVGVNNPFYSNNVYQFNGTSQYLTVPKIATLGTGSWEFIRKIKFNKNTTLETILSGGVNFSLQVNRTAANKLQLLASSNGTTWDIADGVVVGAGLGTKADYPIDTYIWIKTACVFNSPNYVYTVSWSLDGVTYTPELTKSVTTPILANIVKLYLGATYTPAQWHFGSADMAGHKFTIGSTVVFDGSQSYTSPVCEKTFSNGKHYIISHIDDITGLTADGTYTYVLEEGNLYNNGDGTYSATVNAVKLGYTYSGLIPPMTSSLNGYSIVSKEQSGWNPYNLIDGRNTGVSYYTDSGGGSAYATDCSLIGNVVSVDSTNNKITFSGEHVSTLYGATKVVLGDGGQLGESSVQYTFNNPVYDSGTNTTTITLLAYATYGWDGSHSNYNITSWATLSAGYVTPAGFVGKTMYAKHLATLILNMPYLSTGKNLTINNTDTGGAQVAISYSTDGLVYTTLSTTTLATGVNTIALPVNFTNLKISFIPRTWTWTDTSGQWAITHYYSKIGLANLNVSFSVNLLGGNITEANFNYQSAMDYIGADGDYFLNTSVVPYKGLKNILGTVVDKAFLKIGEHTKSGGILLSPVTFAFNRLIVLTQAALAINTKYVLNHNIGTNRIRITWALVCNSTDNGYLVGDKIYSMITILSSGIVFCIDSRLAISCITGATAIGTITPKGLGASVALTPAKWDLEVIIEGAF